MDYSSSLLSPRDFPEEDEASPRIDPAPDSVLRLAGERSEEDVMRRRSRKQALGTAGAVRARPCVSAIN
jgi:hypothetical protein